MEMGINWWQDDAFLSSQAKESELQQQNKALMERLEKLEASIKT
jgi:hypothetical protein